MIIKNYTDLCKQDASLRPYQQKAKKEIFESWDEVDNVMFQMPTGTGKTKLFTSIIRDINDYSIKRREAVKILIIAHRTELIYQIAGHLDKYKVPHNIIIGGKEKNYKYPVSVASIQTITNVHNIKDAKKLKVQFIIIDEAHHALAASYKKLWEMYPDAKRLGVTATPWRMNHQSFLDLFDKLVMSMPIKDFIRQGYLSPYKYFSLRDDSDIQRTIDDLELDKFGEYKESSMEEKMDIGSIRAQLLDSYLSLAEGKKGIIYAINIAHAKHICKEYEDAGYKVVSIDSKTPSAERDKLVKDFRKGLIDIIVNVDIFSEGFDCPDIEFIQLARPTRSLVKYLQQVGRGLRPTENKQNCVILDNVGMYSRFGLPDARRHWNYHFKGKKIDEEPAKVISKGTGKSRYVDLSEGTEDMELIQDVYEDIEPVVGTSSDVNDFFPLFGVSLGKTRWKQAEDLGATVEIWEKGPDRTTRIKNVDFWDHDGVGVFTSLYWVKYDGDFSNSWKSKGFSWDLSYDEWLGVFKNLGFDITVIEEPRKKKYSGRDVFAAIFQAISPDGTLYFRMVFDFGEHGSLSSSPKTLFSVSVIYKGLLTGNQEEETEVEDLVGGENDDNQDRITNEVNSAINDFFPLFGITLGKTTWKQVEDMGYEVEIYEGGPDRITEIENVNFWDFDGTGIFTSLYWSRHDGDFSTLWKNKGFSWDLSYDDWLGVFKNLGFEITIKKQPSLKKYSGRNVLKAEFEALSSDGTLEFRLNFNYGEHGCLTSSPETLWMIAADYNKIQPDDEEIEESPEEIQNVKPEEETNVREDINKEAFNPQPLLHTNNYTDDNFIFWSDDNEHIYEAYIQDDTYFILSELIINSKKHCTHRKRVGKIPMDSWMFWQMEREKVDNLKSITHYAANYTVFHYQVLDKDKNIKDKYFDYKGREIDTPKVVQEKYEIAKSEGQLSDYIDVPVSKATYSVSYKNNMSQIIINRTLKKNTKSIAVISVLSDFGKFSNTPFTIYRSDENSFSIRFEKDGKKLLYRFNFQGKLIHKGSVATPTDVQTTPLLENDTDKLWHVFDSKASSYKLFWFLSILQLYKETGQALITHKQILARMISNAWQYLFKEGGKFPQSDQIPKHIDMLLSKFMLDESSDKKAVESNILYYYERSRLNHHLSPLLKNVPYRFLSPWIPFTSNDDVVALSNLEDARCLYSLQDDHITINPLWRNYLKDHYKKIESFIEQELRAYLKCEKGC